MDDGKRAVAWSRQQGGIQNGRGTLNAKEKVMKGVHSSPDCGRERMEGISQKGGWE
jgi:hypothetical protein